MSRRFERARAPIVDTDAATMIEYALMICICALVAVAAISTLGVRLGSRFDAAAAVLSAAAGGRPRGCDVGNGSAASKNPNC